jgi:hypothetical protein
MDDADGKLLPGQFVEQEGTMSRLQGSAAVLRKSG